MEPPVVQETNLQGIPLFKRGKVRDVYDLGGGSGEASASFSHDLWVHLLIVASDRISAFDVVLPTGIPYKGIVLTQLSAFWFSMLESITPSHFVSAGVEEIIQRYSALKPHRSVLAGRSMLVKKAKVIPMECVVRGYIAGSGWKEYQAHQSVCGVRLPPGLRESEELPAPIFTPATKEEAGHDLNISEEEMARRVGHELTQELKRRSLDIYLKARDHARSKGIIIADTKFEFGLLDGKMMAVDEILTPDSSRFWPVESYAPGKSQVSFDKQFVRDYLESIHWNKTPPAPALPEEIVRKTSEKYLQAYTQLTGKPLPVLV